MLEDQAAPTLLVTRPEPQASAWAAALHAQGLPAAALPLLHILPHTDHSATQAVWQGLAAGDVLMFVSPAAVASFFAQLGGRAAAPHGVRAAATGPGTVQALVQSGWSADAIAAPAPDATQFDSEALWQVLSGESWTGRRVTIVRGEGGRDWLASRWTEAGAEVGFLEAYRRCDPAWNEAQWAAARAALAEPGRAIWWLSSSESLDTLGRLLICADWQRSRAWATHPRIADAARRFGFGAVALIRPGLEAALEAMRAPSTIASSW